MRADVPGPVLVIGGGIAGLTCALELHRAGAPVQLLEAGPDVGGRVRSTVVDGFVLDHGFQVLFTAYPTLRRMLDLPALRPRRFRPGAHIVRDGRVALIGDALRDPSLLLPTLLAPGIRLADALRLLALRRFACARSVDECLAPPYTRISTREFLLARGFGPEVIDGFFAPFYGGILLDRSLSTSASILLFTFKMLAEGDTVVPAAGMGAIPRQLASRLPAGVVRCATPVASLELEHGRIAGVRLADGMLVRAPHVVVATDPASAARLAETIRIPMDQPPGGLGCTTVYFTARRTPIPGRALWLNAAPEAAVSHAVTLTDVAPEYATDGRPLVAATAVGEPATWPDDQLEQAARRELLAMGGQTASDAGLERVGLFRVPYAQFAQPPGAGELRPTVACAISGLWRASEVLHSSSLEGAAQGGVLAARAVLAAARAST
jgi:protoporphyrinogen oxidase